MAVDVFATTALVRQASGFESNTDVTDGEINLFVNSANAEVLSCVAQQYTLPLSGNANYSSSPAQNYLIELAVALASGECMYRQYEGQGGDVSEPGIIKIREARSQLKKLKMGSIKLFDSEGSELAGLTSAVSALMGFPNDSTDDDTKPKFEMTAKY